jgi:Tfp pilus assembly protein PilV
MNMHACRTILNSPRPVRRSQYGFTLVELLLATVGVSLVAVGISSMLMVVAYGSSSSRDMRSLVVKQKSTSARINAAIRGAKQVLETGIVPDSGSESDNYIVLWMDDDEDSKITLNEIKLINFSQQKIYSHTATDTTPVEDVTSYYDLITDTQAEHFTDELWATGINSLSITLDNDTLLQTKLVNFQMDFAVGILSDTTIGTAALRNHNN